jgi:Zn-dependent protease
MNAALNDGLLNYLFLVILVTFHEFGHAWMADRCGDDTPRLQGRVTLNPIAHMDIVGTVVLPLLAVMLTVFGQSALSSFIIGWGRPVQFNPANLRHRGAQSTLIALAGPAMNVLLAAVGVGLTWVGVWGNSEAVIEVCTRIAYLSLFLCFFNLLPIPPLDGSHVLRWLTGTSEEVHAFFSQWGFFLIIIMVQLRPVQLALAWLTVHTHGLMLKLAGLV